VRLKGDRFYGNALFHRLREQRYGIGEAPAQGVCRAQSCSYQGEKEREMRLLTDVYSPFEQGERLGQVALAEGQQTSPPRGYHKALRVSNHLGNLGAFFPES
jgi:hypothetical protein